MITYRDDPVGCARHDALRRLAAETLARDPHGLHLPPPLRYQFEAGRALPRSLELRATVRLGVAVYVVAVLLINFLVLPRTNVLDVAMQVIITPALALLIASLFFRPDTPPVAREGAATVAACCFTLSTVLAVGCSPTWAAQLDFSLCCLPVMYVLAFCRLHFAGAVAFVLFTAVALATALLVRDDVAAAQREFAFCVMLAAALPALAVLYRLEIVSRNLYLQSVFGAIRHDDLSTTAEGFDEEDLPDASWQGAREGVPADPV